MATHDYVLDNATGANFRADLNLALAAIVSNNSSSSEPSTKYAYQWWADTNDGVLKIRNSANDGWVTLLQLDGTLTLEDGSNTAPALGFRDDLNTGIFSSAADTLDVTCGGTTRGSFSSSGLTVTGNVTATTFVGNIDAVDGDFDGTLEADAITVAGTALATVIAGTTVTTATNASHVSVADNESTNENNLIPFIEDASATGNVGLESDGDLHYNPSTGTVTATKFVGDGSGLTNVAGSGTTINSNAVNRLITGSNTADTLEGQSELTFDGNSLKLANSTGTIKTERHGGGANFTLHGSADSGNTATGNNDDIGNIVWQTADGTDRNNVVAYMSARGAGSFSNSSHPTQLEFWTTADSSTTTTKRVIITKSGNLIPATDNTHDLGDSSNRWANIYTNDLKLSNEGGANDVDGSWGSYTIQEGNSDLFLINHRSGKKFKFNLTEVN